MRTFSTSLTLVLACTTLAQVSVDRPVQLTGTGPEQRQVTGLPASIAPSAVLATGTEQTGQHRNANTTLNGANWHAVLPALVGPATAGTQLLVTTPSASGGLVSLEVNDQAAVPVLAAPGVPLAGDAYPAGTILSLVYDGAAYHVMNGRANARRSCPDGMVAVNEQYCIEPDERGASNYFQASLACISADRRLCSWGELYAACVAASSLGLNNMVGNWEWTRDSANEDGNIRMALQNSCAAASTRLATDTTLPIVSRCCYSR
ncbi:MAG: hypothetical protein JNL52_15775 [Flavobacteriales bacterium]|nr:hypothetical protein [Flavobacteriales bacterium]